MEKDSERRRERLKAMRAVAAEASDSNVETSAGPGFLANPLLESPSTLPSQAEPGANLRFGFYTDPMAAFSADKRRGPSGNQPSQGHSMPPPSNSGSPMPRFSSLAPGSRNQGMVPSPSYQMQSNYMPHQGMHQVQGPYNNPAPYRNPGPGPFPMHQGPPAAWNAPGDGGHFHGSSPYRGPTSPYPRHDGYQGYRQAGNSSLNYGQGRPPWRGNNPSHGSTHGGSYNHSGRGQGQWRGNNRGQFSGRGGGRGRGFYYRGSATDEEFRPESYYERSMMEDPWEHLEPVVWRTLGVPGSSHSWIPKSISMKKPRVLETFNNSNSKQSLAEYLAASFNEAAKDAPSE